MKIKGKVLTLDTEVIIKGFDKMGHPKETHKNGFTMWIADEKNGRVVVHATTFAPDFKAPRLDADVEINIRSGERLDTGNWEVVM